MVGDNHADHLWSLSDISSPHVATTVGYLVGGTDRCVLHRAQCFDQVGRCDMQLDGRISCALRGRAGYSDVPPRKRKGYAGMVHPHGMWRCTILDFSRVSANFL